MISKNNCKVYNCPNNIEFIHSDFLEVGNLIRVKIIFRFSFFILLELLLLTCNKYLINFDIKI